MTAHYSGPFDPPPRELREGMIGWRFEKEHDDNNRWHPVAWTIIYADTILTVDYRTKIATRSAAMLTMPEGA